MTEDLYIGTRKIGPGQPCYVIAELSANHNHDVSRAEALVHAAKEAGADAIKLQTYRADTITLDSDRPDFEIGGDSPWRGRTLFQLYEEASMPWDWQPGLFALAERLGLHCFSSPFDPTAVDFLEGIGVPAYKVASSEVVDIPLLRKIASTGKPVLISSGMADTDELDEAIATLRDAGAHQIGILKCTAAYPSPVGDMNLRAIPMLAERYGTAIGLSDHSMNTAVPVTAVALGAAIVEKHLTLRRADGGPDSGFSLEPEEFAEMVTAIRIAEQSLGKPELGPTPSEITGRTFRRSLFVVADVAAGETISEENVRSIRPGHGLHTRYYNEIIGRRFRRALDRGTPLTWDMIAD